MQNCLAKRRYDAQPSSPEQAVAICRDGVFWCEINWLLVGNAGCEIALELLILGRFAGRSHFDDLGIETSDDLYQIGLVAHDLFDVFVDFGGFIQTGG